MEQAQGHELGQMTDVRVIKSRKPIFKAEIESEAQQDNEEKCFVNYKMLFNTIYFNEVRHRELLPVSGIKGSCFVIIRRSYLCRTAE